MDIKAIAAHRTSGKSLALILLGELLKFRNVPVGLLAQNFQDYLSLLLFFFTTHRNYRCISVAQNIS